MSPVLNSLTSRQKAIGISLVIHALILTVLLVWVMPPTEQQGSEQQRSNQTASKPDSPNQSGTQSQPTPPAAPASPLPPVDVDKEQIKKSLDQQIEAVNRLPDEKKLSELERNARRLEAIADEQSVRQTATAVAESFGVDTSQYVAANDGQVVEGELDPSTAQIANVTRRQADKGGYAYFAEMVDQQGHRSEVPVSVQEGEKLYETFELIRKYPMMEGVYRSVVMPMLQKLVPDHAPPPVTAPVPQDSDLQFEP
ncbi:hypothetical protein [Rhodopirellula sp. MGV]|uniref:hypothetical protein n=1 Tax=Rhodopirellula sp. MGV TaxID=2023130 RepID=UPI000B96AC22|nr:hypothetical protein [Rhodopirellula sp. MGV]OYP36002.1 hypothetical protein CGZ80_09610 [Rhodopirellula sp. MGV]PNY36640.1 hypothetical protein C2E31_12395 [Rhodopirellula baltica]